MEQLFLAVTHGSNEAYLHLGSLLDGSGYLEDASGSVARRDPKVAIRYFQKASDRGIAAAQVRLGDIFLSGRGVNRDHRRAFALYQAAAGADDIEAMDRLGRMLELGLGTHIDLKGAIKWYKRSANKGNAQAYLHLAALCEGHGDMDKATQYYVEVSGCLVLEKKER
jgi:TPR repeat protein